MANPRTQKIGDMLVKARVIDELQLRSALASHENWGGRLAHVVAEMGLATEERIVETLAKGLGVQRIRLGNLQKDATAMAKLDARFVEEKGVFPVQLKDNGKLLLLAMADPSDLETVDEVGRRSRSRVQPFIAGESEIKAAIDRHYKGLEPTESQKAPRGATLRSLPEEEEDEFKIVDMSGKTVMKKLSDIDPAAAAAERRSAPPVSSSQLPPVVTSASASSASSTADLLDDILGGGPAVQQLSDEDLQRLGTVQANQEKSAKIIRAVMELLMEKGYVTREQLQERLR